MPTIDQFEKGGRLVLWIALAAATALVPIGAYGMTKANARTAEEVRADALKEKAEKLAREAASKPARLKLSTMGMYIAGMDGSIGNMWFSNASDRAGIVCALGVATSEDGTKSVESLAACKEVEAYASNVKLSFMFAGGEISSTCGVGRCRLSIKEIAIPAEPAVAKR